MFFQLLKNIFKVHGLPRDSVVLKISRKHYMAESRIGIVSKKGFWSTSEHAKMGTERFELVP